MIDEKSREYDPCNDILEQDWHWASGVAAIFREGEARAQVSDRGGCVCGGGADLEKGTACKDAFWLFWFFSMLPS